MADFSTLIATLQATIKTNYNQEITGQILQDDLLAIVDAVNRLKQDTLEGYAFYGAPLADGASVAVTQNTFFLVGKGTYTINGISETTGEGVSALVYDSVDDEVRNYPLFVYDTTPTQNSGNAITSGAVKTALDAKADKSTTYTKSETDNLLNGKQDTLTFDNTPTEDSPNPVTSGGIFDALESAVDGLANIIATKQPKDTDAVADNVAVMDASGSSVDGGVALTDLATKADVEAVEQEVAQIAGEAGLAEAVIDTDGAGTEQEFTFRKSGGDGGAYYRKIKGKTIAWNQLGHDKVATYYYLSNCAGSLVNWTANAAGGGIYGNSATILPNGHRILVSVILRLGNTANSVRVTYNDNTRLAQAVAGWQRVSFIATGTGNAGAFNVRNLASADWGAVEMLAIQFFDLTLAGAADEISTAADFEALYPDIYPNNPGTLISNDAEAVETTGVNQWDEEFRNGYYDTNNGQFIASNAWKANKNPIFVVPNATYYNKKDGSTFVVFCYDKSGNYLGSSQPGGNAEFTPIIGTSYINFYCQTNTTYVCINLSNAAINGQYFPYWKRTLQLGITTRKDTDGNVPFPNGLQSCPVAQDEATKEGGTIRVGTRAYQAGDESDANVITDGTNTNYTLATPVPFTWAEPLNLGVKVDENGTERAVAPEGATAPSAPFVADTTYTMSVARMVEKLQNL